jgi:hypothetical protein
MAAHKYDPHCIIHQRTNKVTQTGTPNMPCSQLERSPILKISPPLHTENQNVGPSSQHTQSREHQRPNQNLENTPILPQFALASLDITNLYTNIPVKETWEIIANTLRKNQTDPPAERELLNWYDTITKQNYFSNKDKILIQLQA